ncbi:hypothetical protein Tco_0733257 [Tanacetum coccineum]
MVAFLEKTNGNAEFHEIIDFLTRSSIYYALTIRPVVSTMFVEQFWMTAKSKTINNVRYITATVAGKPVSISKASVRSDLQFNDAAGIDVLPRRLVKFMKIVSNEDASDMIRSVNDEEIKHAMFDIDNNKAPGPDGYSSKFFKQAWDVNATIISLVPKLNTPNKVFDFSPIAYDLLVLCHGDVMVRKALDHLCNMYGLNPNMGKSTVFLGNLRDQVKRDILNVMPFKVVCLLVSYLGVPLITKQIGINECKGLIDKVKGKILNWKNKMLTYTGRLQLIAYVLSALHMY